jgi:hypothetical protein
MTLPPDRTERFPPVLGWEAATGLGIALGRELAEGAIGRRSRHSKPGVRFEVESSTKSTPSPEMPLAVGTEMVDARMIRGRILWRLGRDPEGFDLHFCGFKADSPTAAPCATPTLQRQALVCSMSPVQALLLEFGQIAHPPHGLFPQ